MKHHVQQSLLTVTVLAFDSIFIASQVVALLMDVHVVLERGHAFLSSFILGGGLDPPLDNFHGPAAFDAALFLEGIAGVFRGRRNRVDALTAMHNRFRRLEISSWTL